MVTPTTIVGVPVTGADTTQPVSDHPEFQLGDPALVQAVFECVFYAAGLMGLVSNVSVLLFMCNLKASSRQQGRSMVLVINQCLIDLLSSLSLLLTYSLHFRMTTFGGIWAKFYCRLIWSESLLFLGLQASVFNMVALSAERLLIIVWPLVHLKFYTKARAVAMALIVWLLGILVNIPTTMMSSFVDRECVFGLLSNSLGTTQIYGVADLVYSYFLPLAFLAYSYTHMLVTLRRRHSEESSIHVGQGIFTVSHPVSGQSNTTQRPPSVKTPNRLSKAELNLFQMMFTLTVCFVLCWTPTQAYFFGYALGAPLSYTDPLYYASITLAVLNSTFNPCIYILVNHKFHKRFKVWLQCTSS